MQAEEIDIENEDWNESSEDLEPLEAVIHACRACEAVFAITLGPDFLSMDVRFCPYCSEPLVENLEDNE